MQKIQGEARKRTTPASKAPSVPDLGEGRREKQHKTFREGNFALRITAETSGLPVPKYHSERKKDVKTEKGEERVVVVCVCVCVCMRNSVCFLRECVCVFHVSVFCVCVFVSVRVCARERERESRR